MFFSETMPRSMTHTRCKRPYRASIVVTIVSTVVTSAVLQAKTFVAQRHPAA